MKKLTPVIVVAAILAAAAFWVMSQQRGPDGGMAGQRVLEGFRPELVGGVFIEGPEGSVRLKEAGGRWGVVERSNYPADVDKIRSMILEAWNMRTVRHIRVGEGSLARLQLVAPGGNPPSAAAETATRLQFLGADGTALAEVLLGLPRVSDPVGGMPGRAIGRYVMAPGRGTADLVSEMFPMVVPAPASWLDRAFVEIENPVRLEKTGPDGWVVKRENDAWVPEGTNEGAFQPGLISSAVSMWRAPSFDDLGSEADLPDQQSGDEVVITTEDEGIYKIRRGAAQGLRTPIRIAIEDKKPENLGEATTPDPSPTAEAGGDGGVEAVGDGGDTSREAISRRVQGQVYLMPTSLVDALFIRKSDLFVEPDDGGEGENQPAQPN